MIRLLPGFIGRAALWYYKIIKKNQKNSIFLLTKWVFIVILYKLNLLMNTKLRACLYSSDGRARPW